MGFAAEMPSRWARGGGQIPFDDRELLIRALDHKPVIRILAGGPRKSRIGIPSDSTWLLRRAMARQKDSITMAKL